MSTDKDRAVTHAGGGQALGLRCRTFNLLLAAARAGMSINGSPTLPVPAADHSVADSILWPARGDSLSATAMPVSVMRSFAVAISTAGKMLALTCEPPEKGTVR